MPFGRPVFVVHTRSHQVKCKRPLSLIDLSSRLPGIFAIL